MEKTRKREEKGDKWGKREREKGEKEKETNGGKERERNLQIMDVYISRSE